MSTVLDSFDKWKNFLAQRVNQAQKIGINDEMIAKLAYEIGDFLDEKVEPRNDQELLLKELWDVADESERKVMATLMVKLVDHA
ncbi:DUF3243 domain-containing protein [Longirhabdus pacifica]|uniref:DUF3243 domain-containing protein n=1 Tax=Longirhabdus pacifica TaxID=2305227 RepID=UPI0010088E8E|nr:DUF3243 domain-containing protein [Longirhabdus pacifica]